MPAPLKTKVLLVGIYDTNTAALAPEVLRAYAERFPVAEAFELVTLNLSIFSGSIDEMAGRIAAHDAAIVAFSTYIWNYAQVLELTRRVSGTIILGGPQCNHLDTGFFVDHPEVDVVVSGEGEETFVELLEYFSGQRDLADVRGIVTRGGATPPRPVLAELDSVPSPYPRIFADHPAIEWIAYETSRGCPYLCGFCTWGYSKRMRYHGLERVFEDLDLLLSRPSLRRIYLCDSSLLLDKPRAKAILRHIIERRRDVVLRYEFNAEQLDDEIVELLLQLPENEFNFGVQTITPRALQTMRRPFKQKKFEQNFAKLSRRSERTSITMDVIYGLPGDDLEGFKNTFEYVLGFPDVKWILTNPLILLPGADFYRDREQHGIVLRDEISYVVEATATFPRDQMLAARRIAFQASVVFFNRRLREAVARLARDRGARQIDTIEWLFESLPFPLIEDAEYPYLVPSVASDFLARNRAVHRVATRFEEIVAEFEALTGGAYRELLGDFRDHYSVQYQRLWRFAAEDARVHGWPDGDASVRAAE
jgi:radical SAM superfamily enzyme YgiQ (UPF0313 family)